MIWVGIIGVLIGLLAGIAVLAMPNPSLPGAISATVGLVSLALTAVNAYLIFAVLGKVGEAIRRHMDIEQSDLFKPLGEKSVAVIRALLEPLTSRLGVDASRFVFLRPTNAVGIGPSIIETDYDRIVLVVPPDFLQLAVDQPKLARAMLAHELGHIAQGDTKLWLYASAYARQLMRVFLPFNLWAGAIGIALQLVLFVALPNTAESVARFVISSVLCLMPVLSLCFFYSRIKAYRRRSEELADLASWILTHDEGDGLAECFILLQKRPVEAPQPEEELMAFGFAGESTFGKIRFQVHPTPAERLAQVQHYGEVVARGKRLHLAGAVSVLTYILPTALAVLVLVTFPVFAQAGNAARQAAALSDAKQLGLAMQIYLEDSDQVYPYPQSHRALEMILEPDMRNPGAWKSENPNNSTFEMNDSLKGASATAVENPSETLLFYESVSWPDGSRAVSFADSRGKKVTANDWPKYSESLSLPLSKVAQPLPENYGENWVSTKPVPQQ